MRTLTFQNQTLRGRFDAYARRYPARLSLIGFALIIFFFTGLLLLPAAHAGDGNVTLLQAFFTATSAVCVTGLSVVDTATFWTPFGHAIIALAMQIGGLGVMTLASLLGLFVSRRLGLTQRLLAAGERKGRLGEVGLLLSATTIISLTVEAFLAMGFLPTFLALGQTIPDALENSLFMAVSTFNNGGFVAIAGDTTTLVGNWAFGLLVIIGTFIGALGFPVLINIYEFRTKFTKWSLHSKITISTYIALLLAGFIFLLFFEWGNSATFGDLAIDERILAALLHSTSARTSGIATVNIGGMHESSLFTIDALMFIGSGSAGTGGGIKVSTFAVLILAILAEARGDKDTEAFGKRIPKNAIRLAISVAFASAMLIGISTLALLQITHLPLSQVLFETISAFSTCGLSTGITPSLSAIAQLILIVLMYTGRVGTITLVAALAARNRRRIVRFPEEQPIIG